MLDYMTTEDDPVSRRLRWVLEAQGKSMRGLSLAAGLSATHVERLLARGASKSELETLRKIAATTGVSLSWLATGVGDPYEDDAQRPAADAPSRERHMGDLAGYAQAEADARLLRPQYAEHPVWARMRAAEALTDGPVTGAALAELADYLIRHGWRRGT
jgi:transcriptional regulator with XRE-family HTH domain